MTPRICGTCKHYAQLIRRHWGQCVWFNENKIPKLPVWVNVNFYSGAIKPDRTGCECWEGKE